ncbi:hypothetical protein GALMADRAFT_772515 [Galerina marginata CBS 339.88]|uniref:Uncharacterized protein n=1 Tax=Galerina marginata (strain CBS 339.88) TaxID=685588 RepID=A0A067SZ08_GALM3|nr:hypothetical protein GALMADRAFT_772515 [Galerina marginata CBS 339.88]
MYIAIWTRTICSTLVIATACPYRYPSPSAFHTSLNSVTSTHTSTTSAPRMMMRLQADLPFVASSYILQADSGRKADARLLVCCHSYLAFRFPLLALRLPEDHPVPGFADSTFASANDNDLIVFVNEARVVASAPSSLVAFIPNKMDGCCVEGPVRVWCRNGI